ncbi:endonuclease/exonuclease/phosphatase family protein [Salinimicrobium sp. MT39]|uniref:Endonuclease/exonuclease/phosphatase family protein n=1 Tax=Salinimicrobium profundisediminis TaxID=2994553 RepID=A0A9X3CYQ4_9FLAO|nr:endonuclease/exonuclease/phosphatase family protein [Salinimicrobium profundisediminis]MCX2839065.1 endonuclease/exonuclease/phosphatase family protein [Salinimicrobium profundisediminis]
MKNLLIIAMVLLTINVTAQNNNGNLIVASYNIRWNSSEDGINIWENRKDWLTKSIKFFELDIVGAQEVTHTQLKDMESLLPGFEVVGEGREGGEKGEYSPIFYRKDRFELLDSSTFWLSETPDKTASKGWDAALPRIVTWARFRDKKAGETFYFFNTHFDHRGKAARKNSAELIGKRMQAIAGEEQVILTGDFNTAPDSEPYNVLLDNKLEDTFSNLPEEQIYSPGYTFNSWDVEASGDRYRIDYVFYKGKKLQPEKYHVLDGQRGRWFISDHFPVIAKFIWKKSLDCN